MRDDDPQRTQEWEAPPDESAAGEAREAELRAEVAETDARRAEEAAGEAHERAEAAAKDEEKLSRKERKAKERAAQAEAAAEEARRRAADTERLRRESAASATPRPATLSGASVMGPGLGSETDPAVAASAASGGADHAASGPSEPGPLERPEVVAGIAFAGAFVLARVLKRIFD